MVGLYFIFPGICTLSLGKRRRGFVILLTDEEYGEPSNGLQAMPSLTAVVTSLGRGQESDFIEMFSKSVESAGDDSHSII
ncbi:hypothetical protein STEG23_008721 [Scotinomys teguina]